MSTRQQPWPNKKPSLLFIHDMILQIFLREAHEPHSPDSEVLLGSKNNGLDASTAAKDATQLVLKELPRWWKRPSEP